MPEVASASLARTSARRARRRILAAALLALAAAGTFVFRGPLFGGNLGEIDPGRAYRSAQPTGNLPGLIERFRLGTVLNLRGGSPRDDWYADEVRACRRAGVDFYDLPMSATERPGRQALLHLIDLFEHCRTPLLIHCKSGSDRTGLATAVYLMVVRGRDPGEAVGAFSLFYGHVPLFGTQRLHEPFHEYAGWLRDHRLPHTPGRFRDWVAREYRSPEPASPLAELRPGPRNPEYEAFLFR